MFHMKKRRSMMGMDMGDMDASTMLKVFVAGVMVYQGIKMLSEEMMD